MDSSLLSQIKSQLDSLQEKVVTKGDLDAMRNDLRSEIDTLIQTFVKRIDGLEEKVEKIEKERDEMKLEVNAVRDMNSELFQRLNKHDSQIRSFRKAQNDQEQQNRKWNVRVYNVEEVKPEDTETSHDCITKCCKVFSDLVGVPVSEEEVEVAHRVGNRAPPPGNSSSGTQGQRRARPRPIILRFMSRKTRDKVLRERRKLKGKGVSIGEDLTHMNFNLLKQAADHSATMDAWTTNGKVIAKLKNGKVVRLDIDKDLDATLTKELL
jgi:hypothetical protein